MRKMPAYARLIWALARDPRVPTQQKLVLGAIAGYLAGFLVRGDEGLGVIGHIVLGIVGALVGGFLAGLLFNTNPIDGPFDLSSIVTAVIGAIIVVVVVSAVTGRSRTGRGAI